MPAPFAARSFPILRVEAGIEVPIIPGIHIFTKEKDPLVARTLFNADTPYKLSQSIKYARTEKEIKGKAFLFLNSISTMLIHNEPRALGKFIHSILTKIRINKINGILISVEKETASEIRSEIVQLVDKVIKI